jgi:uncharacterized peroxidase-related enzyme
MARISPLAPEATTGKVRELLEAVRGKLGIVPNLTRGLAHAPAALDGYLQLSGTLARGSLSARDRERLALAIAEANGCDYCLAAHSTIGKAIGLTPEHVRESRQGTPADPRSAALVRLALRVVETRGKVEDADLADFRAAGFDDGAVAEVVAHVALNVFTKYFNNVAATDIDFPAAAPLTASGSAGVTR